MKDLKLWGIFISLIIVVQALGFFVFSGIAWCLFHAGILSPDHPPMGWFPFLTNTCSSVHFFDLASMMYQGADGILVSFI